MSRKSSFTPVLVALFVTLAAMLLVHPAILLLLLLPWLAQLALLLHRN